MRHYKNKIFCSSKNCDNGCDRQITEEEKQEAKALQIPIAYIDVCGSGRGFKLNFKAKVPGDKT